MKSSTKFVLTLICFFCCFIYSTIISAQSDLDEEQEVMVYTIDRSIYRGILVEENDLSIKLKIQTNDILTIPRNEIRKILYATEYGFLKHGKSHKTKGYFVSGNFGLGSPSTNRVYGSAEAELIGGKRLTPEINVGIVLGVNGQSFDLDDSSANQEYFTFGLHGRYYLTKHRIRTFLYSQASYGVLISNLYLGEESGNQVKIQNGVGLHFASKKKYRIVVSLAHNLQYMKGRTQVWNSSFNNFFPQGDFHDFNFWANNAVAKIGLEF